MSSALARDYDRPIFIVTIGLSAFLLFTLELLTGRILLPVFGGLPAVWTTALCFYSGVVFLGYGYAHILTTRMSSRAGGILHTAVAVVAVVAAILAPSEIGLLRLEGVPTVVNVLLALAILSGAPVFLLSTTTPLLSARFYSRHGDAWWLYAVSNAASMAGLLAYPFIIQPTVPLSTQRGISIAVLGLVALGVAITLIRRPRMLVTDEAQRGNTQIAHEPSEPIDGRIQAMWLLASFVPAGLLSATTTHITMDLTSAPLLWIGPLAAYLGSFIIAFSERGRRLLPVANRLVPAAVTVMWITYAVPGWHLGIVVPLLVLSYGILAVAIHGGLALSRPGASHLTRFYLLVSVGGFAATAFVAVIAPVAFNALYEYPVLLVGALAALALLPAASPTRTSTSPSAVLRQLAVQLVPYMAAAVLLVLAADAHSSVSTPVVVALIVGGLAIAIGRSWPSLALTTGVAIVSILIAFNVRPLVSERTFFGIMEIEAYDGGSAYAEVHGTTIHGVQYVDDRSDEPTAYYVEDGPFGDAVRDLNQRRPQGASIGVVGLGVGTMAAYMRPSDSMTFFEVNPTVVEFANNRRYFNYLSNAPAKPTIVLGDARLSLADQSRGAFDLLVLDAFSSDSIPAHLLTQEAMRLYLDALKPGGLVVFHLSNTYLNLAPAVSSTAQSIGLSARVMSYTPSDARHKRISAVPSEWLVVGSPADMDRFDSLAWSVPAEGPVLTDDFADVTRLLYVD